LVNTDVFGQIAEVRVNEALLYHACSNIISHVAGEMCSEIIKHIVRSHSKFSVIVDESTSVANIQSMIVYIRTQFDGHVCTYFLGLLELSSATAEGLEKSLINFLNDLGLTDDVLCTHFIGFCGDRASCMIGEHKGVAALLKAKFPLLQTMHCMAHRLELAVKKSVDTVNAVSHFKVFVDEMHKVYSMSPKNQRELLYEAEILLLCFVQNVGRFLIKTAVETEARETNTEDEVDNEYLPDDGHTQRPWRSC